MSRRSLSVCLLPLLLVTLAACGPAARTDTHSPPSLNGSKHDPVPVDGSATKGDTGTTPPPVSSGPDDKSKPKEEVLPPLGFRPGLLLQLYKPGTRDSEEAYGYDLTTRQLGQLTEGGPGGAAVIALSTDGELLAYLRSEARGPSKTSGLCIRAIQGGAPVCQWDQLGSALLWRPGTHDLYVRHQGRLVGFRFETKELSPIGVPPGVMYAGGFSPDGRWLTYDDEGLALVSLEPGGQSVRFAGVKAGGGLWLAADRLLVRNTDIEQRTTELVTVSLDGKATPIPLLTPPPPWINNMMADATGRSVAINYGIRGGVYAHRGAAIYSFARKEWQRINAGSQTPFAMGWVGQGQLLLEHGETYVLHDPESGQHKPLPAELKGHNFVSASPDGDWLAFRKDSTRELWLYRISTGELRVVDTKGMEVVTAVWAPQVN